VSPHLAAKLTGSPLDIEPLVDIAASQAGAWIVEGAGGVLVPLNEQVLLIDLIRRLKLPVVIVVRSGLGTINHTLLTIEALTRRALPIAGIVMVGPRNDLARENRIAIERYGGITVVGELPVLSPLTPEALGKWTDEYLDPDGHLMEWLR
jgi:dethiobiotin synthetase